MRTGFGAVAVSFLALLAPSFLRADEAEDAALKMVNDIGGHVVRWRKGTTYQVVEVNLTGCTVTPGTLRTLIAFPHLEGLSIGGEDFLFNTRFVTVNEMKEIQELKNLRTLTLTGLEITDAEVKELRGVEHLTSLNLKRTNVSEAAVIELQDALTHCKISINK
jgi:hypothetical protein